jgi:DNA helicase HerA-like ATPase
MPILILFTIIFLRKKNIISNILVKNNIFIIKSNNASIIGIAFRILGKQDINNSDNNLQKELDNLVDVLSRKSDNIKYSIVTYIYNRRKSSALIMFKECKNENYTMCETEVLQEYEILKKMAESIAPHIALEPIKVSNETLPIPNDFGNLTYARVFEKQYEIPKSESIQVDYDIELGYVITSSLAKIPIGIRSNDVFRHIGIFGTTGSGKSNTAAIIASQLASKGFNVIILDWHGEYIDKLKHFKIYNESNPLRLNILKLYNLEETVEIFQDVLELTDPQRYILYIILSELRKYKRFSLSTLYEAVSRIKDEYTWIKDVKLALLRRMNPILYRPVRLLLISNINMEDELANNNKIIIDLSFIPDVSVRRLYALFIIRAITDIYIKRKINNKPTLIVLEEAQNYFNNSNNEMVSRLLNEIRKFRIGLCIITQSPSSVSPDVVKNTNIKIIHAIKSNIDKKIIVDSLALDPNLSNTLDKLDIGDAIISAPNIKQPTLIKIKEI